MKNVLLGCAAAALTAMGAANAAPVVVDFDNAPNNFNNGDVVNSIDVGGIIGTVTDTSANGNAVVYDTRNTNNADGDQTQPFDDPTTPGDENFNPGNILVVGTVSTNNNETIVDDIVGGSINIDFDGTVDLVGFDAFDIGQQNGEGFLQVSVFNAADNLIATFSAPDVPTDTNNNVNNNLFRSVFLANIAALDAFRNADGSLSIGSITFDFTGISGGVDNFRFEVAEVPVPAALPLLLTGFAGLGFASRRRKQEVK